jgi:hypothetical protein
LHLHENFAAVIVQGALAGVQNPEHAEPPTIRGGVCLWPYNGEMLAFQTQALFWNGINMLRFGLGRDRHVVLPFDLVGVKKKFFGPGLGIIENGHLAVPHDDQFLVFKGVQPGDKNVGLQT